MIVMKRILLPFFVAAAFCSNMSAAGELVRLPYVLSSATEKQMSGCDTIYTMPTTHAEFPGGMDALYDFYFKNLPKGYDLVSNMSSNIILLKVFINDKGEVVDAKILRAFNPAYSEEVISVTEKLPVFTPAKYNGRNVCAYRIIKLYFK